VTGGRTGGVPGIGTVAGIGVTGGSGMRVGSVGGGCSYDVGMWVCAVGGRTTGRCTFSTHDLIRQLYNIAVQLA
jgi:hypothetical protein